MIMMRLLHNERCFSVCHRFFRQVEFGSDQVVRGLVLSFYLVSLRPFVSSFLEEARKQICGNPVFKIEIASASPCNDGNCILTAS